MKKLFAVFCAVFMMFSIMSFSALANSKTTLVAESVTAAPGGTVSVPINIKNNAGVWGIVVNVKFDTSVLSVAEVRNNSNVFKNGEITIGPSDFSKGYVRICTFPNDIKNDNTNNGTICTIVFNVSGDAKEGDYTIEFECNDNSVCNVASEYVPVDAQDGKVSIKKSAKNIAEQPTTASGDVIAKAVNGQLVTEVASTKNDKQTKTEIRTNYEYDDEGNIVTNAKGEKQTVTEYAEVIDETDENGNPVVNADSEGSANSDTENSVKSQNGLSLSTTLIICIIIGAVVIAAVIVLAIVLIKKKKKN